MRRCFIVTSIFFQLVFLCCVFNEKQILHSNSLYHSHTPGTYICCTYSASPSCSYLHRDDIRNDFNRSLNCNKIPIKGEMALSDLVSVRWPRTSSNATPASPHITDLGLRVFLANPRQLYVYPISPSDLAICQINASQKRT